MTGKKRKIRHLSIKSEDSKKLDVSIKDTESIPTLKKVILKPIGYPLKNFGDIDSPKLTTENPELFQAYALEMWLGQIAMVNTYLFDQYLYPDYAFQIVKTVPKNSTGKISVDTKIMLENINEPVLKVNEKVTFNDIIGNQEAKQKCKIIMKFLKNPELFSEWIPRNILFYGPPGTGKTMTAKAIGYKCKVPIYLTKATELVGIHVGDGARRVHKLYLDASKGPSIIFIDELDAIGLDRRYQSIRGDVTEVVNALLSEMDGLTSSKTGIITIGATNSIYLLDPSLLNRFESQIEFKIFNDDERLQFFEKYSKKLPIPLDYDLEKLTKKTKGMSGRELKEKILKNALHLAILDDSDRIESHYVDTVLKDFQSKEDPERVKKIYL
ncbi:MAG: AAA family ATPase [Candidatus Helarchaeota archaeon]